MMPLLFEGGKISNLNGGSIRTVADQTYKGAVILGAATNLFGANLTFANSVGGNQALTATGNVTLTGSNATLAASTLTLNPNSPLTITANNSNTTLAIDTLDLLHESSSLCQFGVQQPRNQI